MTKEFEYLVSNLILLAKYQLHKSRPSPVIEEFKNKLAI